MGEHSKCYVVRLSAKFLGPNYVVTFCCNSDPIKEATEPPGSVGLPSSRQPHRAYADGTVDLLGAGGDWGRRGERERRRGGERREEEKGRKERRKRERRGREERGGEREERGGRRGEGRE